MVYELAGSIEDIGDGLWRWFVWIEGESLDGVKEVVYTLDPSFPRPVRRIKDRSSRFKIQDVASSSFTLYARMNLADGSHVQLERHLHLDTLATPLASADQTENGMKPLILAVDDDVSVLEAVVRDLRRQYGTSFKIMRAQSGAIALERLRDAKALGIEAALILSDQRMPDMTGVELLEKASRLYPNAKRALLTAYQDAEAAMMAINRSKANFYLTKPWDPPEELLYPVLDELLSKWQPNRRLRFR